MINKNYLLTPGPTAIPASVSAVLGQPILHHRTPEFEKIFQEVRDGLKYLFQTRQDVLVLSATGTGAMEAAITNLFSREDEVLVINGGKFGERWTHLATAFGLRPIEIKVAAGQSVQTSQVEAALLEHPNCKAILFQASETSTGVQMPTEALCQIAKKQKVLSVCDAITACGVFNLPMDHWGIDVLITGSQKALMVPPGLSLIAFSEKAWEANRSAKLPRFYFDLAREKKMQVKNQTSWTPAISLIQALQESLRILQKEGLTALFERHQLLAKATRSAVEALGLEILAKDSPSTAVTAVQVPASIADGKKIPKKMRENFGVTIVGGQDELEGKIIRLSHLGYCDRFDIIIGISALELTLLELGHPVELGKGVGAALKVFSEAKNS